MTHCVARLSQQHTRETTREIMHYTPATTPQGTWPHEDLALTKTPPRKLKGAASASNSEAHEVAPPAAPAQRVIVRPEDLKQLSASGGGS